MKCRCPDCGVTYSGAQHSGGHCRGGRYGGCCHSFRSQSAFDAHLDHSPGGRCVDVETTDGWRYTARGWTDQPELLDLDIWSRRAE